MIEIRVTKNVQASINKVWDIVSDMDKESNFWHGIKQIKILNKNDNIIDRETTIAFRNSKCMETVTLRRPNEIDIQITKGPFTGVKKISLTAIDNLSTEIHVIWKINLVGFLTIFSSMVKKHIGNGTEEALQRIAEESKIRN